MVNSGKNAQTMMTVVKNRLFSTSRVAARIRVFSDMSLYSPELKWR